MRAGVAYESGGEGGAARGQSIKRERYQSSTYHFPLKTSFRRYNTAFKKVNFIPNREKTEKKPKFYGKNRDRKHKMLHSYMFSFGLATLIIIF